MPEQGILRVAIAGASGLVGSALAEFLRQGGNEVLTLVRRPPRPDAHEIGWDPAAGRIDANALEGLDAVVHLGGRSIFTRWTARRKAEIHASRIDSTALLSTGLAGLAQRPRVFVCASAIGYYGHRGDEELTEDSPPGAGFLPELCQAWEAACQPARQAGIRVVNLRLGLVISRHGGALRAMLPAFRFGLGGVVGNGRQYWSWILLDDLVRVVDFALRSEALCGPVNAVAPTPVTCRQFTRTLARVVRRPALVPLPGLVVRALLGEMGRALLLTSARVRPGRLQAAGFTFQYPELEAALRRELAPGTRSA